MVTDRVRLMSQSDLILELGARAAMQHFGARHDEVREAADLALVTRSKEDIARIQARVAARRLFRRAVAAERRSPLVFRRLSSDPARAVAAHYGIHRNVAFRLGVMFRDLARRMGMAEDRLLNRIEEDARGEDPRTRRRDRR